MQVVACVQPVAVPAAPVRNQNPVAGFVPSIAVHALDAVLFGTKTSVEKLLGVEFRLGSISKAIDGMFGLPSALSSPVV